MILQKAILIAIIIGLSGCTTTSQMPTTANSIPTTNSSEELSKVEALLEEGKVDEAEFFLQTFTQKMPQGWKAKTERDGKVLIAYWDMTHFISCAVKDSEINGKKSISWVEPSYSKAYYLLAYLSVESHNTVKANEYIDKALSLEPDNPLVLDEKGLILQEMNAHTEAIQYFDTVINSTACMSNYEKARALRGKGVSLIELGKLDAAEQALNESLRIAPNNEIALNELEYIRNIRSNNRSGIAPPHIPLGICCGR